MSPSLPVRIPAPGPLATRVLGRVRGLVARQLVERARTAGLEPIALVDVPASPLPDAPAWALIHEPVSPEKRAGFYASVIELPAALALTPREWAIWGSGPVGRPAMDIAPLWGDDLPRPDEDEVEARRRRLRAASALWWWDLPAALAERTDGAEIAASIRTICERETLPSRFPPIPAPDADGDAICAATLGVVHATFAGEIAAEDGEELDPDAVATPPRTQEPTVALLRPLLADLPAHFDTELDALLLAPGPWGTRHQQQLVAVVSDEAPLHRAAALRRRLEAHLGLVDRTWAGAARPAPVVISRSAFHGQLTRRLFRRPLRRLAFALHTRILRGDDVVFDGLRGGHFTRLDVRAELAALITATGAAFRPGATDIDLRDLLLGAWPALIHLCGGGSPLDPLTAVHDALAGRTDPALARVGSVALKQPWGRPDAADRGRATEGLRTWGPALVRLQEVALEVLG